MPDRLATILRRPTSHQAKRSVGRQKFFSTTPGRIASPTSLENSGAATAARAGPKRGSRESGHAAHMTTTQHPLTQHPLAQLTLPGQSHTAEGRHDHTGMYVMHFGFRRDLANLASAVANTPLGDIATWSALQVRWQLFADILHHHHAAEDDYYWPALMAAVQVRGTAEDRRLVAAMEDEHAAIDPALAACAAGFAEVLAHPCESHRTALEVRIVSFRAVLDEHLAHEEGETLPLVQQVMTAADFAASEKAIERHAYPLRMIPVVLPWVGHRLPADAAARTQVSLGPVLRLLHRLLRGGFERRERAAFRYSDVVMPD